MTRSDAIVVFLVFVIFGLLLGLCISMMELHEQHQMHRQREYIITTPKTTKEKPKHDNTQDEIDNLNYLIIIQGMQHP